MFDSPRDDQFKRKANRVGRGVAWKATGRATDENRALSLPPIDGKSTRRVPGARSKRDGRRTALGIRTSAFRHFVMRVTVWRPVRSHKPVQQSSILWPATKHCLDMPLRTRRGL